jgi:hypothetical protein
VRRLVIMGGWGWGAVVWPRGISVAESVVPRMLADTGLGDCRHDGVLRATWPAVPAGEEAGVGDDADRCAA